jgi:hypothetical protein
MTLVLLVACSGDWEVRKKGQADGGADGGESQACEVCDALARCELVEGRAQCICPPGSLAEDDRCVSDSACEALACSENAVCVADAETRRCECNPGFEPNADGCVDIDECAVDNGGCGADEVCANAAQPGAAPACSCETGYVRRGRSCDPVLTALSTSVGMLAPALDPDEISYALKVPVTTERLTLQPSAPAAATILIDGQEVVASGSAWQTPLLGFGANFVDLSVRQPGHPNRDYRLTITRGHQEAYLKGSRGAAESWQGYAVAIDAGTVVVGAPGDMVSAPLVSGRAFIYARQGETWVEQAQLQSDQPEVGDYFGASVAVSGDTAVIGASGEDMRAGAVYVYTRENGVWSKQARLRASNAEAYDFFGSAVAIEGDTLAVGAMYEDSAARGVFASVPVPEDNAGLTSGAAYVFSRSVQTWTQRSYLKGGSSAGGDEFGTALALSGNTLVIGAPAANVTYAAVARSNSGGAYAFEKSADGWTQRAYWNAAEPEGYEYFGSSVAVDGAVIAVGAPLQREGKVYTFRRGAGDAWDASGALTPSSADSGDGFGSGVAVAGDTILVGASSEAGAGRGFGADPSDDQAAGAGAAYLFVRGSTGSWREWYLKASNGDPGDRFGSSVALDGEVMVIGAVGEASSATAPTGDALDNSAAASGAAYVLQ